MSSYKTLALLVKEHNVPEYKCTKKVNALKITKRDGFDIYVDGHGGPITVDRPMFARFIPEAGDYVVIYKGGYVSFSPRAVFEDGYERI